MDSIDDLESAKEDLEPLLLEAMAKAAGNTAKKVAIAKLRKPLEGWLNQNGASGMRRGGCMELMALLLKTWPWPALCRRTLAMTYMQVAV